MSGDCKLKQPEKNCVAGYLPLENQKPAQHHMHADGAVCAHANWVAVEESFYCFDCNSVITAPPVM
jgi:hypothetical protein